MTFHIDLRSWSQQALRLTKGSNKPFRAPPILLLNGLAFAGLYPSSREALHTRDLDLTVARENFLEHTAPLET